MLFWFRLLLSSIKLYMAEISSKRCSWHSFVRFLTGIYTVIRIKINDNDGHKFENGWWFSGIFYLYFGNFWFFRLFLPPCGSKSSKSLRLHIFCSPLECAFLTVSGSLWSTHALPNRKCLLGRLIWTLKHAAWRRILFRLLRSSPSWNLKQIRITEGVECRSEWSAWCNR